MISNRVNVVRETPSKRSSDGQRSSLIPDDVSEYEMVVDEWGRTIRRKKKSNRAPMAKVKYDNRVDSFELFRQKRRAQSRQKRMRRRKRLEAGDAKQPGGDLRAPLNTTPWGNIN